MKARLAFAIATAARPDVLIVDETLSVGDVRFQQKCIQRIQGFIADGSTLLFVSHSATAVMHICGRALYLKDGRLAFDGGARQALDLYEADMLGRSASNPIEEDAASLHAAPLRGQAGSIQREAADCTAVLFSDHQGRRGHLMPADEAMTLRITTRANAPLADPHIGFKVRNRLGVVLFETNTFCMNRVIGPVSAGCTFSVDFTFFARLAPDEYTVTAGLGERGYGDGSFEEIVFYLHDVAHFTILPSLKAIRWTGIANLNPEVRTIRHPVAAGATCTDSDNG